MLSKNEIELILEGALEHESLKLPMKRVSEDLYLLIFLSALQAQIHLLEAILEIPKTNFEDLRNEKKNNIESNQE